MELLWIVLPLALLLVGGAVAAFIWAVRGGQFDDDQTPALRMLNDDVAAGPPTPPATPPKDIEAPSTTSPTPTTDSAGSP